MQFLLRCLLVFVGWWPLALCHALGWCLGMLLWLIPNSLRRGTRLHVQLCLHDASPKRQRYIERRSLIESMKALLEAPAIWFGPRWRLQRWLGKTAEQARMREALAAAPAAIMLTPHLGAWELAGQFVAQFGPLTLLYKPQKSHFNALIVEGRSRQPGAQPVPTNAAGVKALLAALKRGETVGILPDHDPPEGAGRFAPFFGTPAHTTDLVGKLAARTGVAVSAVRFYEAKGLVAALRTGGGQRRFLRADIRRVSFILIAQQLGLSLEEIGAELARLPAGRNPNAADWTRISTALRARIA
ncbi:MAG: MerR family DNA-binding transcriptional regulator, partial [Sinobacteraceae bacterium]|nr:MerR family DNA-binding transcriptional regulator [Nevskiaceae bacterium]